MTDSYEVLTAIMVERLRQEKLKQQGKFKFTCADVGLSNTEKLAVLVEEVGELTKEINDELTAKLNSGDTVEIVQRLKTELLQCGAVIVAWAESL